MWHVSERTESSRKTKTRVPPFSVVLELSVFYGGKFAVVTCQRLSFFLLPALVCPDMKLEEGVRFCCRLRIAGHQALYSFHFSVENAGRKVSGDEKSTNRVRAELCIFLTCNRICSIQRTTPSARWTCEEHSGIVAFVIASVNGSARFFGMPGVLHDLSPSVVLLRLRVHARRSRDARSFLKAGNSRLMRGHLKDLPAVLVPSVAMTELVVDYDHSPFVQRRKADVPSSAVASLSRNLRYR